MSAAPPAEEAVRFDHAAAAHAAAACERTARLLRDTTTRRASLAEAALADGRGPWRDVLVQRLAAVDRRAMALEAQLRALASALRDASDRAAAEQARRNSTRLTSLATARDLGHLSTGSVRR